MGYEKLSHTADLRLRAWGKDYEELFRSAFLGMMGVLKNDIVSLQTTAAVGKIIKIESSDITALLVDFLNEVLYSAAANREIYIDIKFKKLEEEKLEAEIFGVAVGAFDEDIKAVTYHGADVQKNKEGFYETNLVFDI